MNKLGFHCNRIDLLEETIIDNKLQRGEFYNLFPADIYAFKRMIKRYNLDWSIHTPLFQIDWYPQPPTWSFLCDNDVENRELTMKMITLTMDYADELGAEYVVVHFPSPASDTSIIPEKKLVDIALSSCERLAELSYKRNISIHIEGVGASPLINIEFLSRVLKEYSHLRYCFDIAHSSMAALNNGFDLYDFAEKILPFVGSMHLWNTRGRDDYLAFRHIPVHPSQNPEDGWVDVERIIRILGPRKKSLPVIYESMPYYPAELGNYDYREGVKWVKEMLGISS